MDISIQSIRSNKLFHPKNLERRMTFINNIRDGLLDTELNNFVREQIYSPSFNPNDPEQLINFAWNTTKVLVKTNPANLADFDPDSVMEEGGACYQKALVLDAAFHRLAPFYNGGGGVTKIVGCNIERFNKLGKLMKQAHAVNYICFNPSPLGSDGVSPLEVIVDIGRSCLTSLEEWADGGGYENSKNGFRVVSLQGCSPAAPFFPLKSVQSQPAGTV